MAEIPVNEVARKCLREVRLRNAGRLRVLPIGGMKVVVAVQKYGTPPVATVQVPIRPGAPRSPGYGFFSADPSPSG